MYKTYFDLGYSQAHERANRGFSFTLDFKERKKYGLYKTYFDLGYSQAHVRANRGFSFTLDFKERKIMVCIKLYFDFYSVNPKVVGTYKFKKKIKENILYKILS